MQMNAEFKEEQIGTPFVWVGALEGGGRGGGGERGSNPKNTRDIQYIFFSPSWRYANLFDPLAVCREQFKYLSDKGLAKLAL